jgi:transcription elongation factor GreA
MYRGNSIMAMLKLTQEGTRKLEKEIQHLSKRKNEFRHSPEKSLIVSRISEIEDLLSRSAMWAGEREPGEIVEPGSILTIEDTAFKQRYTYMIVHPFESDPRDKKISIHSPIAAAALGRRIQSTFSIQVPAGGILTYTIIDIQNCNS